MRQASLPYFRKTSKRPRISSSLYPVFVVASHQIFKDFARDPVSHACHTSRYTDSQPPLLLLLLPAATHLADLATPPAHLPPSTTTFPPLAPCSAPLRHANRICQRDAVCLSVCLPACLPAVFILLLLLFFSLLS